VQAAQNGLGESLENQRTLCSERSGAADFLVCAETGIRVVVQGVGDRVIGQSEKLTPLPKRLPETGHAALACRRHYINKRLAIMKKSPLMNTHRS
jgi:hypothetical protein